MNVLRLAGDLCHLTAILILLIKIWKSRSCSGVSGKSQVLFAIVFFTRYLDLFYNFISLYNTAMKIFFLTSSFTTVFLIYKKFKASYDSTHDSMRIEYLIVPCLALSVLLNHYMSFLEILWTFSIYLEAVAIMPQLFMITATHEAESITSHYLFAQGLYRALYILNWMYRYYSEGFYDLIVLIAGVIQTLLYADFFYLYASHVLRGKLLKLPA